MTVSTLNNKHVYTGNGVTTVWPYTFPIIETSDLVLYKTDALGVVTQITSRYSIDAVNATVTYPTNGVGLDPVLDPLSASEKFTILRTIPLTQGVDLKNQGPLNAEILEEEFDKLTLIAQQVQEQVGRCIRYSVDENPSGVETEGFLLAVTTARDDAQAAASGAAASETTASGAAAAALISETNAAASEASALASKNSANASEASATADAASALASKNAAAISETNAAASDASALASKNAAAISESNSAASEASALSSKNAAALSEANALASEIAAAASAASITIPVPVGSGGTGAITAPLARQALGAQISASGLEDPTKFSIAYDYNTRQFTITYAAGAAAWVAGNRFTYSGSAVTAAHAATTGIWFVYFDSSGILTVTSAVWDLLATAPITSVYYNATTPSTSVLFDERHPAQTGMDDYDHKYMHLTRGTQLVSGCDIVAGSYTLTTNSVAATTYGVNSGTILDEDLSIACGALTDGGTYRIHYKLGTEWTYVDVSNKTIHDNGTNIYYNNAGALTAVTTNNNWVNYWLFAYDSYSAPQIVIIMGQAVYGSLALAQAATPSSELTGVSNLTSEGVFLYRITYRRGATFSPAPGLAHIADVAKITQSLVGASSTGAITAASIGTDTTNFNKNLTSSEDTVQKALDKLDDMTAGGFFTSQNFTGTSLTATADGFQRWRYTGSSAQTFTAFTISSMIDAAEIEILGTSDTNTISIPYNATGIIRQNGDVELGYGQSIKYGYDSTLGGLYEKGRS